MEDDNGDNGNDFLFFTVDGDHGLVRVWGPNLVAKRVNWEREGRADIRREIETWIVRG